MVKPHSNTHPSSSLISELFRIAATWTDDKARQAAMVNAWMLGQARSLPAEKES